VKESQDRAELPAGPGLRNLVERDYERPLVSYRRYESGTQPDHLHSPYVSSNTRAPKQPLIRIAQSLGELTGPRFSSSLVSEVTADLTTHQGAAAIGERIFVSGRVLDEDGRPVPNTLLELWQANACGRYHHEWDQHDAPLDPNFLGTGRVMTDEHGQYRFKTIKPGSYPWRNHYNAWRPAHIHFSLLGPAFVTRLVTQMYFPGDPLLPFDPIFNCTADERARNRLISTFDWDTVVPEYALAFKFDIVLRGHNETPFEV
jgi:protocatechuate 3,4-dioxygenase, beta subunit